MANVTLLYRSSQYADLALITDCSDFPVGVELQEVYSDGPKRLGCF